jgi:hypothetical protein
LLYARAPPARRTGWEPEMGGESRHDFSELWGIHSAKAGQPTYRGWAKTEALAQARVVELKAQDRDAQSTEYWVVRLTTREVSHLKSIGLIPNDA